MLRPAIVVFSGDRGSASCVYQLRNQGENEVICLTILNRNSKRYQYDRDKFESAMNSLYCTKAIIDILKITRNGKYTEVHFKMDSEETSFNVELNNQKQYSAIEILHRIVIIYASKHRVSDVFWPVQLSNLETHKEKLVLAYIDYFNYKNSKLYAGNIIIRTPYLGHSESKIEELSKLLGVPKIFKRNSYKSGDILELNYELTYSENGDVICERVHYNDIR